MLGLRNYAGISKLGDYRADLAEQNQASKTPNSTAYYFASLWRPTLGSKAFSEPKCQDPPPGVQDQRVWVGLLLTDHALAFRFRAWGLDKNPKPVNRRGTIEKKVMLLALNKQRASFLWGVPPRTPASKKCTSKP